MVATPTLVALVASVVLETCLPYLISAAVATVLMVVFVVPSEKSVRAAEVRLDSAGAASHLGERFGL